MKEYFYDLVMDFGSLDFILLGIGEKKGSLCALDLVASASGHVRNPGGWSDNQTLYGVLLAAFFAASVEKKGGCDAPK